MAEHLVVLSNPVSSRAEQFAWQLGELERASDELGEYIPLQTTPSETDNRAQLYEAVPPNSTLVVASGDGTLSKTVRDMLCHDPARPEHLAQTPIVAFGTGNKNDVAHMLAGRHHANPLCTLRYGREVQVPTMKVTHPSEAQGLQIASFALYSAGVGAIGEGARRANDAHFRQQQRERGAFCRRLAEYGMALDVLRTSRKQYIEVDGETHSVLSLFFSNGNRMAGQWRLPAELNEAAFFVGYIRSKQPCKAIADALGLLTGRLPKGQLTSEPFTFYTHQPNIAQIDGEDFTIAPGEITVEQGPSATFLSTRLQNSLTDKH